MEEASAAKLRSLFLRSPEPASQYALHLIKDTISRYKQENNVEEVASRVCQTNWSTTTLAVSCRDCALVDNSCVCLDCFVRGNHEGHSYVVNYVDSGNCDCGDPVFWKKEGYCPHHSEVDENPHLTQFDEPTRQYILSVLKCGITVLNSSLVLDVERSHVIINWLSDVIGLGDAARRLCSLSFLECGFIQKVMDIFPFMVDSLDEDITNLFGKMINDAHFINEYSKIFLPVSQKLLLAIQPQLDDGFKEIKRRAFFVSLYHIYSPPHIRPVILSDQNIEPYIRFCIDRIKSSVEASYTFLSVNSVYQENTTSFSSYCDTIVKQMSLADVDKNLVQYMFDQYVKVMLSGELLPPIKLDSLLPDQGSIPYLSYCRMMTGMGKSMLKLFLNVKYDSLYDCLGTLFKKQRDDYGLRDGLPLHILLSDLQTLHPRIFEIAASHIGMSNDEFYSKIITYPIALFGIMNKFYSRETYPNHSLVHSIFLNLLYKRNIACRIIPLFSLIQYCLGMHSNKEIIITRIAKAFGVSEEDEDEINSSRIRGFLYFVVALLTDEISYRRQKTEMKKEQVALILSDGPKGINQLSYFIGSQRHADVSTIEDITTTVMIKEQVLLKLKDSYVVNHFHPWNKESKITETLSRVKKMPKILEIDNLDFSSVLMSDTVQRLVQKARQLDQSPELEKVISFFNNSMEESTLSSEPEKKNERAQSMKLKILADFKAQQEAFMDYSDEEQSEIECCVCGNPLGNTGCYPAVRYEDREHSCSIRLCNHLCHRECLNLNKKDFYGCPIDRCIRNSYIPYIPEKPTEEQKDIARKLLLQQDITFEVLSKYLAQIAETAGCHSQESLRITLRAVIDAANLMAPEGVKVAQPELIHDDIEGYGIDLPDDMIMLHLKTNLSNKRETKSLCLLTGAIFDESQREFPGYDTILLALTGPYARSTFFYGPSGIGKTRVHSIYCDRYGMEDSGYERCMSVHLNKERYKKYLDMFRSGEWTDLLQ